MQVALSVSGPTSGSQEDMTGNRCSDGNSVRVSKVRKWQSQQVAQSVSKTTSGSQEDMTGNRYSVKVGKWLGEIVS